MLLLSRRCLTSYIRKGSRLIRSNEFHSYSLGLVEYLTLFPFLSLLSSLMLFSALTSPSFPLSLSLSITLSFFLSFYPSFPEILICIFFILFSLLSAPGHHVFMSTSPILIHTFYISHANLLIFQLFFKYTMISFIFLFILPLLTSRVFDLIHIFCYHLL